MRFDLSDEDWALLEPLLPKSRKSARVDDRKIMNAIFYVLRTGMPWRDLPARYGPYTCLGILVRTPCSSSVAMVEAAA
jgi:transposase